MFWWGGGVTSRAQGVDGREGGMWRRCTEGDEKQDDSSQPEYARSHLLLGQKQT